MQLFELRRTSILLRSLLFLLCGSSAAPGAEPIPLSAGPLTMVFDADKAFLRYVRAGPYEVLRGINAPIRNQFWGTVQPEVSDVDLDDQGDHFSLTFDATCQERDVDFRWRGSITGSRAGEVEFTFHGVAHSTFLRNRVGFCLLHGPSAAGQPWSIQHVNGEQSQGRFPRFIAPHQPAKEIQAVAHELAPNLWAHVEFEGEVFEMEDQRNWTDASFKTYCTPLELPYPVEVKQGTEISQKIRFRVEGFIPDIQLDGGRVVLTLGEKQSSLPRIGLQVSSETEELTDRQIQRLKALHLDHLRVDLQPADDAFAGQLRQAARQAGALDLTLQVGVHLGQQPEQELQRLVSELRATSPPVAAFLCIGVDKQLHRLPRTLLKPVSGQALIGVGNDSNFVDLNRDRPVDDRLEAICYAINPQIHAVDNASMIETLPIQADTVRSAQQFAGERPLMIGPITLRPQQVSQEPLPGELPSDVDARQSTRFAAAWTLGSVKYLAEAGAHSTTYYETVGWKGVMDTDQVTSRPSQFPSTPGDVFPVYHVLRDIGDFAGGRVQQIDSSDALSVVGLVLRKPGQMRLLIANLTGRQHSVGLRGLGRPVEVRLLDDETTPAANKNPDSRRDQPAGRVMPELPLVLPPHAIARIDRVVD